jgi:DNA-binding transcriptional ArsR family regulator
VSSARDATFRAIADPSRRRMLEVLADGERTVNELCSLFDTMQPAVSQHLRVLRDAGLVRHRQHGRHRYYSLDARPLRAVYDWSAHYQRFWTKKLEALADLLTRENARKRRGDA